MPGYPPPDRVSGQDIKCISKFGQKATLQLNILSGIQITIGAIYVIFEGVSVILQREWYFLNYMVLPGGAYFILIGTIGLVAVRKNTKCWIKCVFVLNLINILLGCPLYLTMFSMRAGSGIPEWDSDDCHKTQTAFAMSIVQLIAIVTETIASLWSVCLCTLG